MTALFVTHDQAEAFALGDRVAVMREGRVVQVGTPDELWAHPADTDVARFLGLANVRDGTVVRPEAVTVRHIGAGDAGDGVVESLVRHGPTVRLTSSGSTTGRSSTPRSRPRAPGTGRARLGRDRSRRHRSRVIRRRVVVHGFVQGVFFRDSVRRHALTAGVTGWVRNNRDGTVEAVFEGEDAPSSGSSASAATAPGEPAWIVSRSRSRRTARALGPLGATRPVVVVQGLVLDRRACRDRRTRPRDPSRGAPRRHSASSRAS